LSSPNLFGFRSIVDNSSSTTQRDSIESVNLLVDVAVADSNSPLSQVDTAATSVQVFQDSAPLFGETSLEHKTNASQEEEERTHGEDSFREHETNKTQEVGDSKSSFGGRGITATQEVGEYISPGGHSSLVGEDNLSPNHFNIATPTFVNTPENLENFLFELKLPATDPNDVAPMTKDKTNLRTVKFRFRSKQLLNVSAQDISRFSKDFASTFNPEAFDFSPDLPKYSRTFLRLIAPGEGELVFSGVTFRDSLALRAEGEKVINLVEQLTFLQPTLATPPFVQHEKALYLNLEGFDKSLVITSIPGAPVALSPVPRSAGDYQGQWMATFSASDSAFRLIYSRTDVLLPDLQPNPPENGNELSPNRNLLMALPNGKEVVKLQMWAVTIKFGFTAPALLVLDPKQDFSSPSRTVRIVFASSLASPLSKTDLAGFACTRCSLEGLFMESPSVYIAIVKDTPPVDNLDGFVAVSALYMKFGIAKSAGIGVLNSPACIMFTFDHTSPSVSISFEDADRATDSEIEIVDVNFMVLFNFSEPVRNFSLASLALLNAEALDLKEVLQPETSVSAVIRTTTGFKSSADCTQAVPELISSKNTVFLVSFRAIAAGGITVAVRVDSASKAQVTDLQNNPLRVSPTLKIMFNPSDLEIKLEQVWESSARIPLFLDVWFSSVPMLTLSVEAVSEIILFQEAYTNGTAVTAGERSPVAKISSVSQHSANRFQLEVFPLRFPEENLTLIARINRAVVTDRTQRPNKAAETLLSYSPCSVCHESSRCSLDPATFARLTKQLLTGNSANALSIEPSKSFVQCKCDEGFISHRGVCYSCPGFAASLKGLVNPPCFGHGVCFIDRNLEQGMNLTQHEQLLQFGTLAQHDLAKCRCDLGWGDRDCSAYESITAPKLVARQLSLNSVVLEWFPSTDSDPPGQHAYEVSVQHVEAKSTEEVGLDVTRKLFSDLRYGIVYSFSIALLVKTDAGYIQKSIPTRTTVATVPLVTTISVTSENGTLGGVGNTQGGDQLSITGSNLVDTSEMSATDVRVFTGPNNCSIIPPVLPTLVRCQIETGSGKGLPVVVQSAVKSQNRRHWISAWLLANSSKFSYSYSAPSLSPNSLRLQPTDSQPFGDIVGTRLVGDVLNISGTNLGNDASVVSVIYENKDSRLVCTVLSVNHTWLTCLTSLGKGAGFHFWVIVNGLVSQLSDTNTFQYPERPTVRAVGKGNLEISTEGGIEVDIFGTSFALNEGLLSVLVGSKPCINPTSYSRQHISCFVPENTGRLLSVVVIVASQVHSSLF